VKGMKRRKNKPQIFFIPGQTNWVNKYVKDKMVIFNKTKNTIFGVGEGERERERERERDVLYIYIYIYIYIN